jgi:hypothetical protein
MKAIQNSRRGHGFRKFKINGIRMKTYVLCLTLLLTSTALHAQKFLLTPDEARRLNYAGASWREIARDIHGAPLQVAMPPRAASMTDRRDSAASRAAGEAGPAVRLLYPELRHEDGVDVARVSAPVSFGVIFEPAGADVDMDTLRVYVVKGFFTLNITDRVKEFLQGKELKVSKLAASSGKYRFRVEVADVNRKKTSVEWLIDIVEG